MQHASTFMPEMSDRIATEATTADVAIKVIEAVGHAMGAISADLGLQPAWITGQAQAFPWAF
jgi:hypothetical protein